MDWVHTKPPFGVPVKIFNHYQQVRQGVSDGVYVHLTDCNQPMDNSVYPSDEVVAWKLLNRHPQ